MSLDAFPHIFRPASGGSPHALMLLHGTGGSEHDLLPLADRVAPGAAVLSPRGKVIEHGAARFFRRFAEGVLDIEDWRRRSGELADFIAAASEHYGVPAGAWTAFGYSNGANIAQGLLLLRPEVLAGAILIRPMFVTADVPQAGLAGRRVLVVAGSGDPLMPPGDTERISAQLGARGADVSVRVLPATHGMVQADLAAARDWLLG